MPARGPAGSAGGRGRLEVRAPAAPPGRRGGEGELRNLQWEYMSVILCLPCLSPSLSDPLA